MTVFFGVIAALLMLAVPIPYIRSILRGKTVPSKMSWWIWTLVGVLNARAFEGAGGDVGRGLAWAIPVGTFIVAVVSLKRGRFNPGPLDWICLGCALVLSAAYLSGLSPMLALVGGLSIDLLAFVPTVVKARKDPESEDPLAWFLVGASGVVALLGSLVAKASLADYVFPLHFVGQSVTIQVLFFRRHHRS